MRGLLLCWFAIVALGCNAMLGISGTSLREEGGAAGQGSGASANLPATSAGASTGTGCTRHAECLERSGEFAPSACIAGRCVALLTPECPLALPQTERRWLASLRQTDPAPVIFGVFASVPPELLSTESRNYDLALTELSRAVGGLPSAAGKRHPVLAVVCRNLFSSGEAFDRAIDHLSDELKVPGIIAGLEAADLEYAFRRKGRANHIFFISPFEADPALLQLVDDGLLWHMLSGGEQLAPTYAPLLARTLSHLRGAGRLAPDEPARVALVTAENVRLLSNLSAALTGGVLHFNGRPARQNSPDYFREVAISSSALVAGADYSAAIRLLQEFSPHVIIAVASAEFVTTIMPALEAGEAPFEPFYLLSPLEYDKSRVRALLEQFPKIYARMAGINFAAAEDPSVFRAYEARFDAAFPAFAGQLGHENHYDAAYYLLYAAAAAGPVNPLFGGDLVNGMRRLLSGRLAFSVGPEDLPPALLELENPSSSIVLNGAMGPPNFDPRTGARDEPGTVWCVDSTRAVHSDVLRVDAQGDLTGTFPCFEFGAP